MHDPLDELTATPEDIRRAQIHKLRATEKRIKKLLTEGLPPHAARKPGVKAQVGVRVSGQEVMAYIKDMSPEERGRILEQFVAQQPAQPEDAPDG